MKLLLDTHVWLWLIGNPSKLPRAYADAIANAEQPIALSVASLWEVGIKQRQGKLAIDVPFDELLERGLSSVEVLDIRLPHVLRTNELPMLHRDPFDRMLIAQALVEGLTLLTVDHVIPAYGVPILPS